MRADAGSAGPDSWLACEGRPPRLPRTAAPGPHEESTQTRARSRTELYAERRTCPGRERRAGSRGRLVLTWGDARRLTWAAQGPPGQTRARVSRGA